MVTHFKVNNLISEARASILLKQSPAKIFKTNFGEIEDKSYFKLIDEHCDLKVIDLEVSNYIVVPQDIVVEGNGIEKKLTKDIGTVYLAKAAGIFTAYSPSRDFSCFIRIQKQNYIGFAEYRHLEN